MKLKIICIVLFGLFAVGAQVNQVHAVDACTGDNQITLEAGCGCAAGFHSPVGNLGARHRR